MLDRNSERSIVFMVSAVQFVNILDFVMVMPLGPDFATALAIPASHLGYIGGAYTASAAISGIAGSLFLDRFDRRKALAFAMLGLVIGTALGGFATSIGTLLGARIVAGAFGGPAASISLSIIADVIPPERRGRAMGVVMGSFSLASVLGIPAGLELARQGGWRAPFFGVAGIGMVIAALSIFLLPPLTIHLTQSVLVTKARVRDLFSRRSVLLAYLATTASTLSAFLLIPNISAYVQQNLGYPREELGSLYFFAGIASFFAMRFSGPLVDRLGSVRVSLFGTLLFAVTIAFGFVNYFTVIPVLAIFTGFMVAQAFRNVSLTTTASKVPLPNERASFMSVNSAVQHIAAALGSFLSAAMLTESPQKTLEGMETLGIMTIVIGSSLPLILRTIEKKR